LNLLRHLRQLNVRRRLLLPAALLVLGTGCATVKSTRLRADYDAVDKHRVKRLVVLTQPLPAEDEQLGELWSLMARRYVNQKRNFLAKENLARDGEPVFQPKGLCQDGIEGVLWLRPELRQVGKGVEAQVRARLFRCGDFEEVWAADAGGSWDSADKHLQEVTAQYVAEFGPRVEPFVAPTFRLLKATLDTLPNPELGEDDISEKIELDE
jgi:probable lipoprotein (TIGR04455 family)